MPATELPALAELERILAMAPSEVGSRVIREVATGGRVFPIHAVTLGNPSPTVPAVGFIAGVHGPERIGTEVVLALLHSLVMRLRWDRMLHQQLASLRLLFVPIVNPGGMWRGTRANPNGVDLMRNAPLESTASVPFLIGGHRLGNTLPWYRGPRDGPMEAESQALCQIVEEELLVREFSMVVDCHSGFGLQDRIWFPNAHTPLPMAHLAEIHALKEIFDEACTHHRYVIEPQSRQYLAHGDLWDYLYLRASTQPRRILLPLTLEMGSWLWVKKNPRQLFARHGIFNPLIEHRQQRVLRRHLPWLEVVSRAAASYRHWLPTGAERLRHHNRALDLWYHS